jgi:ABC-type polysaccharide/polyol phosphate transport system ATPase subunit
MSDFALQVEKLGKVFRIYDRPSDRLKETFSFGRKNYHTDFPALRNISFHVKKGEFLGIVGRNGAGKSTLLKILSGELTPSEGTVTIDGNVSLLQLGVGFDLELSGVENARFASKLLGYSNREIDRMLKDIIEFADIGDFIYHPVKTYSSGMYSRLSFAVGVNINPDILIADEVLAVGDLRFAQKCLRKMREFKDKGKTIVLVTHDTSTVNVFCDTAIWLKDGELFQSGDAQSIATDYTNYMLYDKLPHQYDADFQINAEENEAKTLNAEQSLTPSTQKKWTSAPVEWDDASKASCIGEGGAVINGIALYSKNPYAKRAVLSGTEHILLYMKLTTRKAILQPQFGFVLYDRHGLPALHTNSDLCDGNLGPLSPGQEVVVCFDIKLPGINNGNYIFAFSAQDGQIMHARIHDVLPIQVLRTGPQSAQCGHVIIDDQHVEMEILTAR